MQVKNPAPLVFLLVLFSILAYVFFFASPEPVEFHYPVQETTSVCSENQTQYCSVGSCSGLSTCVGGKWSACKWERICEPGSKAACIEQGCAKGLKECNECGTAYGPCE